MTAPITMLDELIEDNQEHLNDLGVAVLRYAFHEVARASIEDAKLNNETNSKYVFEKMSEITDFQALKQRQIQLPEYFSKTNSDDLSAIEAALSEAIDCFAGEEYDTDFTALSDIDVPKKSYDYAALVAEELKKNSLFTKTL